MRCQGVSLLAAQLNRFVVITLVKKAQILCKSSFEVSFVHKEKTIAFGIMTHNLVGEMRKQFGEITQVVGEMKRIVGEMKQVVGEMKQNCWENEAILLGKCYNLLGK